MNTPDAFTPDGAWILGEAPEVANYFVCVGMNGNSLQVRQNYTGSFRGVILNFNESLFPGSCWCW